MGQRVLLSAQNCRWPLPPTSWVLCSRHTCTPAHHSHAAQSSRIFQGRTAPTRLRTAPFMCLENSLCFLILALALVTDRAVSSLGRCLATASLALGPGISGGREWHQQIQFWGVLTLTQFEGLSWSKRKHTQNWERPLSGADGWAVSALW